MPISKSLKRSVKFLPLALFIAVVLFSCITGYHFAYHITDSDMSSEMVLGKLLADQNKIMTTDWYYSTEIRVFNTNLIYMPLFKIFSDWHMIRFISILIFMVLYISSYFYLSRRIKMSMNAFYISASLMLVPISDAYGCFALYQNHYTVCFIFGFLIAGLYLSFIQHGGQRRIFQTLRLVALLALAFISCLNGFRQLPSTLLPLLLTALVFKIKNRNSSENPPAFRWQHVGLAGLICAAGFAGLLIHTKLLPLYCGPESMKTPVVALISTENSRDLLVDYLSLFCYQEGSKLFSFDGLISMGSIAAAAVMLLLSLETLFKKDSTKTADFAALLYPVSMALMTIIFILVSGYETYARYYQQTFFWIFPFLGVLLDRHGISLRSFSCKKAVIVLTCIMLFIGGVYYNQYYLDSGNMKQRATNGLNTDIYSVNRIQPVIEFLEEDGYEVGYATHWNANIITELTEGRIPMISITRVYPEFFYLYRDWLTNKHYRELSFVEDKYIFLMLTREEADIFSGSELAAFGIPVYEDENCIIFTFDFSTEVWEYLLNQAEAYNQRSVLDQLLPEGD